MSNGMYDDQLQEVLKLLEEQPEGGDPEESEPPVRKPTSKEVLIQELMNESTDEVLVGEQAAMAEFAMMMKHWEALVEDYEHRDAEEKKERRAQEGDSVD